MADKSAFDRLNDFMATAPQRDQFKRSRTEGRGKTSKVVEETDEPGYQRALQQWKNDNADTIGHLKDAVNLENQGTQLDLTRQGAQTNLAGALNTYLSGGEHRAWELGGLGGLVGGGLLGRGIAKLSAPAPAGTGPWGRATYAVVPAMESLLGLGKAAEQYATQPNQLNDPRGYDLHQASMQTLGAAGLGALTGGIENALANRGPAAAPAAASMPPQPPAPAPLPPPPEPNLEKGMSYGNATKEVAKFLGQPISGKKADVTARSITALGDASDDQIRGLASRLSQRGFSIDPNAEVGALRKGVRAALKTISGTKPGTLGALALGGMAGLEAVSPDEAQAGTEEGPRRDESLTQYRLRSLGLPSTPEEAGQTALDLTPFIGEARMGTALGQAGRGIMGALTAPSGSVTGELSDPRLARYRNWVEDQRQMGNDPHQQALSELSDHMDKMHSQYGKGTGVPTGAGMAGLTGVPGAGGGLPAVPAAMPPQTGMGMGAPQQSKGMSTSDILAAINSGRERGALLAMLAGGQ